MNKVQPYSLFTDFDIDLFKAGKHFRLYEKLGAHLLEVDGVKGVYFAVWAPSARSVSVVGDFNGIHQEFGKVLFKESKKEQPTNIKFNRTTEELSLKKPIHLRSIANILLILPL